MPQKGHWQPGIGVRGLLLRGVWKGGGRGWFRGLKELILLVFVLFWLFLPFAQVFNGILRLG